MPREQKSAPSRSGPRVMPPCEKGRVSLKRTLERTRYAPFNNDHFDDLCCAIFRCILTPRKTESDVASDINTSLPLRSPGPATYTEPNNGMVKHLHNPFSTAAVSHMQTATTTDLLYKMAVHGHASRDSCARPRNLWPRLRYKALADYPSSRRSPMLRSRRRLHRPSGLPTAWQTGPAQHVACPTRHIFLRHSP
jgi:hypothetical protein